MATEIYIKPSSSNISSNKQAMKLKTMNTRLQCAIYICRMIVAELK